MKRFKTAVCILMAVVITCVGLPFVGLSVYAAGKERFVIWEANADLLLLNSQGNLNAESSESGVSLGEVKKASGCYHTEFIDVGAGTKAMAVSSINSSTTGFGWMGKQAFLKALSPYLYVSFEYKVESSEQLPDDAKLTLYAGQKTDSEICTFAEVPLATDGQWAQVKLKKISGSFENAWNDGYFTYKISSASSGLVGTQTVELKNIYLSVEETDRLAANSVFKNVSEIKQINNFSTGVSISKDRRRQDDYFELLTKYDENSSLSENLSSSTYFISIKNSEHCDVAVSQLAAEGFEDGSSPKSISIYTSPAERYHIDKVIVETTNGTAVEVTENEKDTRYSFTMPASNVKISLELSYEEKRDIALLWYSNIASVSTNPWYLNTNSRPYSYEVIDGGDRTAYKFTITNPTGAIITYGTANVNVTPDMYWDTAEFVVSMRLESESGKGTVAIGNSLTNVYKKAEVGEEWTTIRIPLKEMAASMLKKNYAIDISSLSEGDVLYVSDACVWNKPTGDKSQLEMFEELFDLSGYTKSETNTLIDVIGDPDGMTNPYNTVREPYKTVVAELAWYTSFQNVAPWFISIEDEAEFGNPYRLVFFPQKYHTGANTIDVSDYEDTGYMEFYVQTLTDGTTFPLSVYSDGANANFVVKYDASKARPDGYMRVRIPFTFFSDMGVNLSAIKTVSFMGAQTIKDSLMISSFRFYTNLADVPDPEPLPVEEPVVERDLPIELDSSILNAYLDKENMEILVPEGTELWELLSAITFDTNESNVSVNEDGIGVFSRNTVLTDNMTMRLFRRGFVLGDFDIYYLTTENMPKAMNNIISNGTSEESQIPNTGDENLLPVYFFSVLLSGFVLITLGRKISKSFI